MLKLETEYKTLKFVIEEDLPCIGFYLYVYKKEKCIADHLQDTLETIKEVALEEYGISKKSWNVIC